jgi:signal peptidase I
MSAEKTNWRAELKFYALFFAAFFAFRTTAFATYHIPSESMLPTLAVGDVIAVNKFAYGYSKYSTPLALAPHFGGEDGRVFARAPKRGDVAVFAHPATGRVMVKRLIGLPGDEIAVVEGALFVNGVAVPAEEGAPYRYREWKGWDADVTPRKETIGARTITTLDRGAGNPSDDFGPAYVPPGHYFMMGDNRDNSLDSRFDQPSGVGMVPAERLIGRADGVLISFSAFRTDKGVVTHRTRWFSGL